MPYSNGKGGYRGARPISRNRRMQDHPQIPGSSIFRCDCGRKHDLRPLVESMAKAQSEAAFVSGAPPQQIQWGEDTAQGQQSEQLRTQQSGQHPQKQFGLVNRERRAPRTDYDPSAPEFHPKPQPPADEYVGYMIAQQPVLPAPAQQPSGLNDASAQDSWPTLPSDQTVAAPEPTTASAPTAKVDEKLSWADMVDEPSSPTEAQNNKGNKGKTTARPPKETTKPPQQPQNNPSEPPPPIIENRSYAPYDPYTLPNLVEYKEVLSFKTTAQWESGKHHLDECKWRIIRKIFFGKDAAVSKKELGHLARKPRICRELESLIVEGQPGLPKEQNVVDGAIYALSFACRWDAGGRLKILVLDGCPYVTNWGFKQIAMRCESLEYVRITTGANDGEAGEASSSTGGPVRGGITNESLRLLGRPKKTLLPRLKEVAFLDQSVTKAAASVLSEKRKGLAVQVGWNVQRKGTKKEGGVDWRRSVMVTYFNGKEVENSNWA